MPGTAWYDRIDRTMNMYPTFKLNATLSDKVILKNYNLDTQLFPVYRRTVKFSLNWIQTRFTLGSYEPTWIWIHGYIAHQTLAEQDSVS